MPATTVTAQPKENLENIRRQLADALKNHDALELGPNETLRDFEYRAKKSSDTILALKIAEQVQKRLLEQDSLNQENETKKKSNPNP